MCNIFKVSHSSYYYWITKKPSERLIRRLELGVSIKKVYDWSKGRYGSPRIAKELQMQGKQVSVNLVARIMKTKIIDLHTSMSDREDLVYDKVYLNKFGVKIIARVVAKSICPKRSFSQPANGKKINMVFIVNSITEAFYLENSPPKVAAMYLDSLGSEIEYANCGMSGFNSIDFQPSTEAFKKVILATDQFSRNDTLLVFSIKFGTNGSASNGMNRAPVSPAQVENNLQNIIDSLHSRYPKARIIINYPSWYSLNTPNNETYLHDGLSRLISYRPAIKSLVHANRAFVTLGDIKGFDILVFKLSFSKAECHI